MIALIALIAIPLLGVVRPTQSFNNSLCALVFLVRVSRFAAIDCDIFPLELCSFPLPEDFDTLFLSLPFPPALPRPLVSSWAIKNFAHLYRELQIFCNSATAKQIKPHPILLCALPPSTPLPSPLVAAAELLSPPPSHLPRL